MGWSWALFFCHSALQEAGKRALVSCGLPPVTLADWEPSPKFTRSSAVVAPYVDNGNVIAGSPEVAEKVLGALVRELEDLGFKCHERVDPTPHFEMVGRVLDGERRCLRPKATRMWRLWHALEELLHLDTFTGKKMQRLTGHLVDHFALRREALSVLHEVYRFQQGDLRESKALPPALRAELRVCQGLLPLVVAPH